MVSDLTKVLLLAAECINSGKLEEAQRACDEAGWVQTGNAVVWLKSYARALELQPEYAATHNNRGNLFRALGEARRAPESFDSAAWRRPPTEFP